MKVESAFHTNFKLQGKSFKNHWDLIDFSLNISLEINLFLKEWFNSKEYIDVSTSGSTGKSKVVQLQKKHMIHSAIATGEYFNLYNTTKALLCMSPVYIAGKMMLVRALILGWHLDVVDPGTNPLKNCTEQYDFTAMVPLQLHHSLADIYKVKKVIVGGGAVSNELLIKIQHIETQVFETYGMTETITHIAVKKLNNFKNVIASKTKQSVYKTLPNINISIDNRNCLVIDAPNVSQEKIITNDLVDLISEKTFIWLGRFDSIINSGGIKLIPEQIEKKLTSLISNRFFVAGLPDNVLGEKLILIIENEDNIYSKENLLKEIKELNVLSKYEVPKEIFVLQYFIETPTKKISRKETIELI